MLALLEEMRGQSSRRAIRGNTTVTRPVREIRQRKFVAGSVRPTELKPEVKKLSRDGRLEQLPILFEKDQIDLSLRAGKYPDAQGPT